MNLRTPISIAAMIAAIVAVSAYAQARPKASSTKPDPATAAPAKPKAKTATKRNRPRASVDVGTPLQQFQRRIKAAVPLDTLCQCTDRSAKTKSGSRALGRVGKIVHGSAKGALFSTTVTPGLTCRVESFHKQGLKEGQPTGTVARCATFTLLE